MNASSDAAEQVLHIVLNGYEVMLRLSGSAIKQTAKMLIDISKDHEKNSVGKTNLLNMLKTCKDIKIFTIQRKDLDKFVQEGKKYGILYCTLLDKDDTSPNSEVDILVRGEDATRVNRIVEKYNLSVASLRTEEIKEKGDITPIENELEQSKNNVNEDLINDVLGKKDNKDSKVIDGVSQDFFTQDIQSKNFSNTIQKGEMDNGKKSVREELKECKEEVQKAFTKDSKEKKRNKKDKKKKLKGDKNYDRTK